MKKTTAVILLALILLTGMVIPVYGQTSTYVVDNAGLLTSDEIADLENTAKILAAEYSIDPVILTVPSMNGISASSYAESYYDQAGYSEDGVLFLLALTEREWYISTCGSMIYALTDYGIQNLGENAVYWFSSGHWYDGFYSFYSELDDYLDAYQQGDPVDGYANYSNDNFYVVQEEILHYKPQKKANLLLSILIGLATSAITVLIMRSSMNTKRAQRSAAVYMDPSSWELHHRSDLYLYSNVTKTRRQQNTSGGSSVHRSSSGRRHGGGGGKF